MGIFRSISTNEGGYNASKDLEEGLRNGNNSETTADGGVRTNVALAVEYIHCYRWSPPDGQIYVCRSKTKTGSLSAEYDLPSGYL